MSSFYCITTCPLGEVFPIPQNVFSSEGPVEDDIQLSLMGVTIMKPNPLIRQSLRQVLRVAPLAYIFLSYVAIRSSCDDEKRMTPNSIRVTLLAKVLPEGGLRKKWWKARHFSLPFISASQFGSWFLATIEPYFGKLRGKCISRDAEGRNYPLNFLVCAEYSHMKHEWIIHEFSARSAEIRGSYFRQCNLIKTWI